jgi:hypothetical protein
MEIPYGGAAVPHHHQGDAFAGQIDEHVPNIRPAVPRIYSERQFPRVAIDQDVHDGISWQLKSGKFAGMADEEKLVE